MPQQTYAPPPGVRFEAIGEAWNLVKPNLGTWVVAILAYLGVTIVLSLVVAFFMSAIGLAAPLGSSQVDFKPAYILGNILQNLIYLIPSAFFTAGLFRMALKSTRGAPIQVGDLFNGSDVIGPMIVAMLLTQIAAGIGLLLCILPGIYVGLRLYFAPIVVADRRVSGIDAMRMSWDALGNHVLSIFAFGFVLGLVNVVGALLCGVGLFATIPVTLVALAIVYRDLLPDQPTAYGPTLDMPLPPPSAYQPGSYPPQL